MGTRSADLLVGFLEQVSWRVLDEYREIIRDLIRRRSGVYALYKQDRLYYIGLASNLMGRVNGHLKDRHRGAWDRFSVYLTTERAHIKPLESLLLRIAKPAGNRVSGGFGRPINLYRSLHRAMSESDADRRAAFSEVTSRVVVDGAELGMHAEAWFLQGLWSVACPFEHVGRGDSSRQRFARMATSALGDESTTPRPPPRQSSPGTP